MKKLMLIAALVAATIVSGCRSVEVVNNGQDYVRTSSGDPVLVDGKPILYGKGWTVDHFQHWMITKADTVHANIKPEEIEFSLNGLDTKPDAEGVEKLVEASAKGAAELAAKIGAAVATSGGSAGADAIYGYVRQFLSKGGDPGKASVTISDGMITCTDGSCSESWSCPNGECSE